MNISEIYGQQKARKKNICVRPAFGKRLLSIGLISPLRANQIQRHISRTLSVAEHGHQSLAL